MRLRRKRRVNVCVIYKNGRIATFRCSEISVKEMAGGSLSVSWADAKPAPLKLGVSDVSAIYSKVSVL